jgi:hypothetical protein
MDLYISSLLLGATGLTAMALSGLGSHGHSGGSHGHLHAGHGHAGHLGHGHAGHGQLGHGHGAAGDAASGHAASGHAAAPGHGVQQSGHGQHSVSHGEHSVAGRALWAIASPRFLFSFALGFGAAGLIARPLLGGPLLAATAVAGAVLFERALVSPLWNFLMRFASNPAQTLESAVTDEATAVTAFDANGDGIVSVEVDGQVQQILATLRADDRRLGGARVRAGQRVRIEEIDAERNRCTVSLL